MAESNDQSAMEYLKSDSSHNFTVNLNTVIEAMELHPDFLTYLLNARRTEQNQTKIPSKFVVDTAEGLRFLVGFMKSFRKHPVTATIADEKKNIQNTPPVGSETSIDLVAAIKFAIDSMEQLSNDTQLNQKEQKTEKDFQQPSSKLSSDFEDLSVSETVVQTHTKTKIQDKTKIVSQEPTLSIVIETDETIQMTPEPTLNPKSTSSESCEIKQITQCPLTSEPPSKPKTKRLNYVITPPPKDYKMCITTFDGAKGNDAHDFIVSLEAYKDWGAISDEQTYNELHRQLTGNALAWWKKHKHIGYINTWEEAKKEMRIMFQEWPPHRVFKQILKTKQGNQRSRHYFNRIESLLEKLPEGYISEAAKADLVYCLASDKIRIRVPRCTINNVKDIGIHGYGIEVYNSLGIIRREEDILYDKSTKDY